MINIFAIGTSLLFAFATLNGFAQNKKVTVLGSSTAEGTGASNPDSSWVARLNANFTRNLLDGKDTIVKNRAKGGTVTYNSLPTDYTPPTGRPSPDPDRNVTYVLTDLPRADVVIINYPTNDIAYGYDPKEMMDNLRLMYNQLTQNGIRCYVATTQPRDLSDNQRLILRQLVDSIQLNFPANTINFWDDLATADGHIKSEVSANDGIHVNDLGHRLLFQRVLAKNILSTVGGAALPLALKSWQVNLDNKTAKISWTTAYEGVNTTFEIQRSEDGRNFQTLYQKMSNGGNGSYSWIDVAPLSGKNFYRLRIIEGDKSSYSRIIPIINDAKQLITSLYTGASKLHVQLNSKKDQSATVTIITYSGTTVKQQSFRLNSSIAAVTIPISELAKGNYFLRVTTSDGSLATERFAIMK